MKPIELHEKAMHFSFLAKQARGNGNEESALLNYEQAAKLESEAAQYYFEKPELEPTRSILVRSAAILNLKAGLLEEAERFIFWGIMNAKEQASKDQLYEALEISLAFKNLDKQAISGNVAYIYGLRKRSILYSLEPKKGRYGSAVNLDMISEFAESYTRSFKAYSKSIYKDWFEERHPLQDDLEDASDNFSEMVNPLLASAGFGSFKFAIASDYLHEPNEDRKVSLLKAGVLAKYHEEVFTNDINDQAVQGFKQNYSDEEIEQIFRPLFKIKLNNSYKIAYYDRDSLQKCYVARPKDAQKKALLPPKKLANEDIGHLESIIAHRRGTEKGTSLEVILRQSLKTGSFDYPVSVIEPKESAPIILSHEILINVEFSTSTGFTLTFEDLPIQSSSVKFPEARLDFFTQFINLVKNLRDDVEKTGERMRYWNLLRSLIMNPDAIK